MGGRITEQDLILACSGVSLDLPKGRVAEYRRYLASPGPAFVTRAYKRLERPRITEQAMHQACADVAAGGTWEAVGRPFGWDAKTCRRRLREFSRWESSERRAAICEQIVSRYRGAAAELAGDLEASRSFDERLVHWFVR